MTWPEYEEIQRDCSTCIREIDPIISLRETNSCIPQSRECARIARNPRRARLSRYRGAPYQSYHTSFEILPISQYACVPTRLYPQSRVEDFRAFARDNSIRDIKRGIFIYIQREGEVQ